MDLGGDLKLTLEPLERVRVWQGAITSSLINT